MNIDWKTVAVSVGASALTGSAVAWLAKTYISHPLARGLSSTQMPSLTGLRGKEADGGGADRDRRGRVCSPDKEERSAGRRTRQPGRSRSQKSR
jgi:hypothetical protein